MAGSGRRWHGYGDGDGHGHGLLIRGATSQEALHVAALLVFPLRSPTSALLVFPLRLACFALPVLPLRGVGVQAVLLVEQV